MSNSVDIRGSCWESVGLAVNRGGSSSKCPWTCALPPAERFCIPANSEPMWVCGARFWAIVAVSEPWVRIARFGRPVLLLVYICTVASLDSIAAVLPSRSGASASHRSHAVQPSGLSPIAAHIDHGCPVAHHQERLAQLVLRHERVRNRTGILKELAKRHRAQVDATFA